MNNGSQWLLRRRNYVTILIFLLPSAARAAAGAPISNRHHPRLSSAARPVGVPPGYVLTRNGWFHSSCVIGVGSDETVGADLVIRGRDGAVHAAFAPCAQVRYDRWGRRVAPRADGPGAATQALAGPPAASPTYDGYIVFYASNGAIAPGSTLSTEWIVPPPPTNVNGQDIALFNAILTSAEGGDILQPVLDFNGGVQGKWSIESEHCCLAGNDMKTPPVVVAPGDRIRGVVSGTGCAATGVCESWTVTTSDVTTGESTTLSTVAPNGVPNAVIPGSLETYGVTSCDMFPAGGATTFMNSTLIDPNFDVETRSYDLLILARVDAEVPTDCGYAGTASGNDYTLIYGESADGIDGGTADGSASRDASIDALETDALESSGHDSGTIIDAGSTGMSPGSDGACSCSTASGSGPAPAAILTMGWLLAVALGRRARGARAQNAAASLRQRSRLAMLLVAIHVGLGLAACSPFATQAPPDDGGPAIDTALPVSDAEADGATDTTPPPLGSFFYTSLAAMQRLSGSPNGFGGDLRFGMSTGLEGADKICQTIAEGVGLGGKTWRAFLSVTKGPDGQIVNAIDRIGSGPWYDVNGRLFANDRSGLLSDRPQGNSAIVNDLPDETGQGTMQLGSSYDVVTGTNTNGTLYYPNAPRNTCMDWTDSTIQNVLVVCGHAWLAQGLGNWIAAHPERSCVPGVNLNSNGTNDGSSIAAGGGWGGFYCFALTP